MSVITATVNLTGVRVGRYAVKTGQLQDFELYAVIVVTELEPSDRKPVVAAGGRTVLGVHVTGNFAPGDSKHTMRFTPGNATHVRFEVFILVYASVDTATGSTLAGLLMRQSPLAPVVLIDPSSRMGTEVQNAMSAGSATFPQVSAGKSCIMYMCLTAYDTAKTGCKNSSGAVVATLLQNSNGKARVLGKQRYPGICISVAELRALMDIGGQAYIQTVTAQVCDKNDTTNCEREYSGFNVNGVQHANPPMSSNASVGVIAPLSLTSAASTSLTKCKDLLQNPTTNKLRTDKVDEYTDVAFCSRYSKDRPGCQTQNCEEKCNAAYFETKTTQRITPCRWDHVKSKCRPYTWEGPRDDPNVAPDADTGTGLGSFFCTPQQMEIEGLGHMNSHSFVAQAQAS